MIYLLYSIQQKCFHRACSIEEVIETSFENLRNKTNNNWIVVAEAKDNAEADLTFPPTKGLIRRIMDYK